MASSGTTPMLVFDDETLLAILDKLFDEIKSEYEFVPKPKPSSSSASQDLVIQNQIACGEALERMFAELQKLKLADNEDEPPTEESEIVNNTGDNGMETFVKIQSKLSGVMDAFFEITSSKSYSITTTIANSTDSSLNDSSDQSSVTSNEGTEDGFESNHDQNEKTVSLLVPMANSTDNSLNDSSDQSSVMSTEGTEDGFESSHDQNEKSIISTTLEHINDLIRKAEDEIENLKQLESQTDEILLDISKNDSSRSSSPFPVYNLSTPRIQAKKYAMKKHADIIEILEPKQDRNMFGKSNYYRKYIMAQRVPQKRAATLLQKIKAERRTRCVFVENIDYPIETIDVVDHFAPCGTLVCVLVFRERNGYALLEFDNRISAHTALAMDGTLFRGRTINAMTIEAVGQQGIRTKRDDGSMIYNVLGERYRRLAIKNRW